MRSGLQKTDEGRFESPAINFYEALGEAIRRERVGRGLSLRGLSDRCRGRLKPSSLGGYERGERAIAVDRLILIAAALGTPPERLLTDALALAWDAGRPEVAIDTGRLPPSAAGQAAGAFAHEVRARRRDYRSSVVTLRAGDIDVVAHGAGVSRDRLLRELGGAVLRVGSDG